MSERPRPLVFITGASSGLGAALARRYQRAGWRLALVARRAEAVAALAADAGWADEDWVAYPADVRQPASVIGAAQACLARQGLPAVVIANAGISVGVEWAEAEDLAVVQATLETNLMGVFATFQPFLTPMRAAAQAPGAPAFRLVGVASVAGVRGLPGHAAYCASKAGVIAACESLRGDCRGQGIAVVTLVPGYVATPLTARNPYRMPFLMQPDEFAEQAFRAIARGEALRIIPWPMAWVARLLRLLPAAALDRLLAGRGRKPRQGAAGSPGA